MQIHLIANRLARLSVDAVPENFSPTLALVFRAIEQAAPGQERTALEQVLVQLPNGENLAKQIFAVRPGLYPKITSLAQMSPDLKPIQWLWQHWIPRGMLSVLGASQGSGKSFVALDLAYRVIHGTGFPDGTPTPQAGANVVYVDGEMVPQILNERAQRYGLNREKLYLMLPDPGEMLDLSKQHYQDRLVNLIATTCPALVLLDSLSSLHSNGQNQVEDVRKLISFLVHLANWADCGLLLLHHIRKTPSGQRMLNFDLGMEDLTGTGYITQQARVVIGMFVVQTGPQPDMNGPRHFKVLKSNLAAYPNPLGFEFEPQYPEGVRLKWQTQAPEHYHIPTKFEECQQWLEDLLRTHPDGLKPKEILQIGIEEGFKQDMIYRAKKSLNLHIRDVEGRQSPNNVWVWSDTDA